MNAALKKSLDLDIKWCRTPDLPSLRYYGRVGIPIFLWDDMADFTNLQAVTSHNSIVDHYRSDYYNAITVDNFMCWYNLKAPYAAHMVADLEALPFLDLEEYQEGEVLPVTGKLVTVSLDLLQELDMYYENGVNFTRTRVDVHPTPFATTKMNVFTWVNTIDQLGAWDHAKQNYKLNDDVDIAPMNTNNRNGKTFYEM